MIVDFFVVWNLLDRMSVALKLQSSKIKLSKIKLSYVYLIFRYLIYNSFRMKMYSENQNRENIYSQ